MSDENPAQSASQNPPSGSYPGGTAAGETPAEKTPEKAAGSTKDDPCGPEVNCPAPPKRAGAVPAAAGAAAATPKTAREQLEALKKKLEDQQADLQRLEPVKTSVADLEQRIQALEKTVDGESASETSHKEFYRATKVQASEFALLIKSVRCDLKLDEKQKKCVADAITVGTARVAKAKKRSDDAKAEQKRKEDAYKQAEDELSWQKKYYEFLKSGVQLQVNKLRDDLKALKTLADPTKDQCVAEFYLVEMEEDLNAKSGADRCWSPELSIGDFLECWPWANCYKDAWNKAIVAFNEAEVAEKRAKSELEQAKKSATDLEKLAKEAEAKRREWILKELKECCAPKATAP
ncbi:MAG TPA: hypothetical protein VIK51_02045 [Vicinamibacteria bacterium]|jgi:hypothetical protein